jgi:hypothetical protein
LIALNALNKVKLAAFRFLRVFGFLFVILFNFTGFVSLMQAFKMRLRSAESFRRVENEVNKPVRLIISGAREKSENVREIDLRSFNGIFTAF